MDPLYENLFAVLCVLYIVHRQLEDFQKYQNLLSNWFLLKLLCHNAYCGFTMEPYTWAIFILGY